MRNSAIMMLAALGATQADEYEDGEVERLADEAEAHLAALAGTDEEEAARAQLIADLAEGDQALKDLAALREEYKVEAASYRSTIEILEGKLSKETKKAENHWTALTETNTELNHARNDLLKARDTLAAIGGSEAIHAALTALELPDGGTHKEKDKAIADLFDALRPKDGLTLTAPEGDEAAEH